MRYKLNPETITAEQIESARKNLEATMRLNKWLPNTGWRIKSRILTIMAETAVEASSMLGIPTAKCVVVYEKGWVQTQRAAEAWPITMQRRKNGRDRIHVAQWYLVDLAGKLQGPLWQRIMERDLRDLVAHEYYHLKEARTTPNRYKRELRRGKSYRSLSELAANLFAESHSYQKDALQIKSGTN